MNLSIGSKYLITLSRWFLAPDGQQYKGVFGTVTYIASNSGNLEPNCDTANRFVTIKNLTVNADLIISAVRTDVVDLAPPQLIVEHEGKAKVENAGMSYIYNADGF